MRQVPWHSPETDDTPGKSELPGGSVINWQHGPIGESFNGATIEGVIRAAIMRTEELDRVIPCVENRDAAAALQAALHRLDARTRDRHDRGVMGTRAS